MPSLSGVLQRVNLIIDTGIDAARGPGTDRQRQRRLPRRSGPRVLVPSLPFCGRADPTLSGSGCRPGSNRGWMCRRCAGRMIDGMRTDTDEAAVVTVRDLRKAYGGRVVVDGLNLDVRAGEGGGLIGAN